MAQTSDRVSSIAARYANLTPERLLGLTSTDDRTREAAADIRAMAASLMRQDEVKGVRKLLRLVMG
jgi:hypothetical protein